jgi:hypothetical protein
MRAHRCVASRDVLAQAQRGGRRQALLLAGAFQRQAHGIGMRHAALQRLGDGRLQRRGAVAVEQAQQRGGDRPEVVAAPGGMVEQLRRARRGVREPVHAAVLARGALVIDQGLHVGGVLHMHAAVPAARMGRDLAGAVEHAHADLVGQHRQGTPHVLVRHRVVVQIEAHVRRLAYLHGQALAQRIGVLGQCHQARALGVERLSYAQAAVLGPRSIESRSLRPGHGLGVQVGDVGELACGEEGVADVADAALDAALLVAAGDGDRARLEGMVGGKAQQRGVEADGVAHALEHGALEVVVQQHARAAAEGGEGLGMAAQEAVHPRVEEEAQEDAPRVTQHHHEGHQRAARAADMQMAEVAPVDLRLLARQSAQPQERLGRRARAHAGDEVAEVVRVAAVAALADHREQPRGGQRRVAVQRLQDERPVRVDAAGSQRRSRRRRLAGVREHAPHGTVVDVQLAGDGAHAPALGLVQAQDRGAQVGGDDQDKLPSRMGDDHASRPAPHAVPQEAPANPGRQRATAAAAASGDRRCEGVARRAHLMAGLLGCSQWSIRGRHRATLMRHEVHGAAAHDGGGIERSGTLAVPLAPAPRTRRMRHAAGAAVLVAAAGRAPGLQSRRTRAHPAAIALAAVTAAAQQHLDTTTRAHEQTSGMLEQLPVSSGKNSRGTPVAAVLCLSAETDTADLHCKEHPADLSAV